MLQNEALLHRTRKRIYEHILKNPGVTFQMLKTIFDMNEGTLRYHLEYLRRSDLILQKKQDNNRFYISKDNPVKTLKKASDRTSKERARVLSLITSEPGITRSELSEKCNMNRKKLTRILSDLKKKGFIRCRKIGGETCYEAKSDEDIVREMMVILIRKYLDGDMTIERLMELKGKLED